ncbi:MAG: hypothetical protein ABI119_05935 [Gemmatimonadaceae bacterium]
MAIGGRPKLLSVRRGYARREQTRTVHFTPTPWQAEFFADAFSGDYSIMGIGGAIRGGKSISAIMLLFILCRTFPGSRWAIVRKDLPRIRRNTIPTIEKFAPRPFVAPLDRQEWIYRMENGSEILLIAEQLQTDPDLDRFKGLEVNGFVLEEANELGEVTFNKCKERSGSWIIQPTLDNPLPAQPPALILCTFNPADNWVRSTFYDPWRENRIKRPYYFKRALPSDNPYVTEEQKKIWLELPPEEYKRFIEGDWDAIIDPYQLLTYAQVIAAADHEPHPGEWKLGVDVGGDKPGADDTVFCPVNGNIIDGQLIEKVNGWESVRIATRVRDYIEGRALTDPEDRKPIYIRAENVRLDSVGIGAGPHDLLRAWGKAIRAFVAGARFFPRLVQPHGGAVRDVATGITRSAPRPVSSGYIFRNLRGQAWWEFADRVKRGEVVILNPTKELIRDLTAPRFKYMTEREIIVDSTDDIKEATGHSPDVGTAAVMGDFTWPRAARVLGAGTTGSYTG